MKRNKQLLTLTWNPIANIKMYFDRELNIALNNSESLVASKLLRTYYKVSPMDAFRTANKLITNNLDKLK